MWFIVNLYIILYGVYKFEIFWFLNVIFFLIEEKVEICLWGFCSIFYRFEVDKKIRGKLDMLWMNSFVFLFVKLLMNWLLV